MQHLSTRQHGLPDRCRPIATVEATITHHEGQGFHPTQPRHYYITKVSLPPATQRFSLLVRHGSPARASHKSSRLPRTPRTAYVQSSRVHSRNGRHQRAVWPSSSTTPPPSPRPGCNYSRPQQHALLSAQLTKATARHSRAYFGNFRWSGVTKNKMEIVALSSDMPFSLPPARECKTHGAGNPKTAGHHRGGCDGGNYFPANRLPCTGWCTPGRAIRLPIFHTTIFPAFLLLYVHF